MRFVRPRSPLPKYAFKKGCFADFNPGIEYNMPTIDSSNNLFVGPSIGTLITAFDASYNGVVSHVYDISAQRITYDEVFDYHLSRADSITLCRAFTLVNMKTNPVDPAGLQAVDASGSFNPSAPGVAALLATIIQKAEDASGNIAADTEGTHGYITDQLDNWIATAAAAQGSFEGTNLAEANKSNFGVNDADVDIFMDEGSGHVVLTDVSGSVATLSEAFNAGLARQIDEAHLRAYAVSGTNAGPTILPGLRGDQVVFGLKSNATTVTAFGYEEPGSAAANPVGGMTFTTLTVSGLVPEPIVAFRVQLGCTNSGPGEGTLDAEPDDRLVPAADSTPSA
jgi:hypothetical protein